MSWAFLVSDKIWNYCSYWYRIAPNLVEIFCLFLFVCLVGFCLFCFVLFLLHILFVRKMHEWWGFKYALEAEALEAGACFCTVCPLWPKHTRLKYCGSSLSPSKYKLLFFACDVNRFFSLFINFLFCNFVSILLKQRILW